VRRMGNELGLWRERPLKMQEDNAEYQERNLI